MEDDNLEQKFKELRIQARIKVCVLTSSLILFFLWFANFSWATKESTFSALAMAAFSRAFGISEYLAIPVTVIITLIYTAYYLILMRALLSSRNR